MHSLIAKLVATQPLTPSDWDVTKPAGERAKCGHLRWDAWACGLDSDQAGAVLQDLAEAGLTGALERPDVIELALLVGSAFQGSSQMQYQVGIVLAGLGFFGEHAERFFGSALRRELQRDTDEARECAEALAKLDARIRRE